MNQKIWRIDLHCHLDGSLSLNSIKNNLKSIGQDYSIDEIKNMCTVSKDCDSLTEYLTKFDLPIKSMYDYDSTKKTAKDFMMSLVSDDLAYIEVRFSPALIATDSYSDKQVLEAVIDGLNEGSELTNIKYNIIICAMRHHSLELNKKAFELAKEYYGYGVCGVDLAGDENYYPTCQFADLFKYAGQLGLNITIHAGECHSSQSIRDAIGMGATRIGHGIAMTGDLSLQNICKNKKIGIEMCPISNYQTSAVGRDEHYPFKEFYDNNLLVTINTDNRTVSGTSLKDEFEFLKNKFNTSKDDEIQLFKNGVEVCFASENVKNNLLKLV